MAAMIGSALPGAAQTPVSGTWREIDALPDATGRKGIYAGVSNGWIVLGGGSNFPVPLREGGTKTFHRSAYVRPLPIDADQPWQEVPDALAGPLGEGASVSVPEGIVGIGGHDGARLVATAFLLQFNPAARTLQTGPLPPLPAAHANLAATHLDGWIYAAGGETSAGASAAFYRLDLRRVLGGQEAIRWEVLPSWPGRPRLGCILVPVTTPGGARLLLAGGVHAPAKSEEDYLADAHLFDPLTRTWRSAAAMPRPAVLPAALAIAASRIALFGGSDGHDFARMRELGERYRIPNDGFVYDAVADRWVAAGRMPLGLVAPAVVKAGGDWLVAGGEYSPGRRTPRVFVLDPQGRSR
jgi:N-acetylneuraminic acid mutarotase